MARLALPSRPSRLAAVLLLLAAALAAPAAAASGLPSTFAVPAPQAGEAWTYAVLEPGNGSAGNASAGGTDGPLLLQRAFTQAGPATARDADGQPVGVALLAENQTWKDEEGRLFPVDWSHAVAADGATVASTRISAEPGAQASMTLTGLPGNVSALQSVSEFSRTRRTVHDAEPFCGHRSDLQGRAVTLSKGVRLLGCGGAQRFTALAQRDWNGKAALVLGLASAPQSLQAWFVRDVPVPVRLFEQGPDGAVRIHELVAFTAGSGPLSYGSPDASPLPAVVWAPHLAYGLDEAGVEHPFPASAAYLAALSKADSALARFLAAHPAADLRSAAFSDLRDNHHAYIQHDRSWTLVVSDGPEAAAVVATQSTLERADAPAAGVPPVALPPGTVTVEDVRPGEGPWPEPAAVPASLPTVASLVARWQAAHAGDAKHANSWGFRLSCAATCAQAALEAWAGADDRERPNDPGVSLASVVTTHRDADLAAVDAGGREAWAEDWAFVRVTHLDVNPLVALSEGDQPEATPVVAASAAAGLPWTAVAVAAAGALAGLAVLLAWLAKAGPLSGLFSREIDDVSAHPVRAAILEAVRAEPGIHHSGLMRRVGKGNAVVTNHVRRLERAGLVSMRQGPRFLCYYPAGTPRAAQVAGPLVKSSVAQRLLQAVAAAPASGQELARRLGVEPGAVAYHVKRLAEGGLVSTRRSGRFVLVEATAEGRLALGALAA